MTKLSPARRRAHSALIEAQDGRGFVRDILTASAGTLSDARDEAFALTLALGVTATVGALDEALDRYIAKPSKVSARVRMALRIPAFEMLYLDTPGHVAVSQGVELVRSQARSASGLANAVLRRVDEGRAAFFAAADVSDDERELTARARRQGIPVWLAAKLDASLARRGFGGKSLCFNGIAAPTCACMCPDAVCSGDVSDCLEPSVLEGSYLVGSPAVVAASSDLAQGKLVISDLNAQLIAASTVRPGSCLEIGAGRGTKTYVMACRANRCGLRGRHVAVDLSAAKCEINRLRLEQAGLSKGIEFAPGDGCNLDATLAHIDVRYGLFGCSLFGYGHHASASRDSLAFGFKRCRGRSAQVATAAIAGGFASRKARRRVDLCHLFGTRGRKRAGNRCVFAIGAGTCIQACPAARSRSLQR